MFKANKNSIKIVINTSQSSLINVSPTQFSDAKLISKEILKGNALVVDINKMSGVEAIRFIDFITGVLFTTQGGFKRLADKVYLLTPSKSLTEKFLTQFEQQNKN